MAKFEVGDEVWSPMYGDGLVKKIDDESDYCICVNFFSGEGNDFTEDGKLYDTHVGPTLFHKGTKIIEAPEPKRRPVCAFKPFDRVLVRNDKEGGIWRVNFFSHLTEKNISFVCLQHTWNYCIPFEGNEHLVGTSDDPKE